MVEFIQTLEESESFRHLSPTDAADVYKELRRKVIGEGLLERNYGYYAGLTTLIFTGFFGSFAGVYFSQSLFVVVLLSLLFAFFSVQIGGLVHDAGHRAVFRTPLANDVFAHSCTLVFAACYSNWRINHNRHHASPNQVTRDPDMEIPYGFTPHRFNKLSGFMGAIKKFQKYTYLPFGTMASLTMRYKRYDYFKENFGPSIYWEIALFFVSGFIRYIVPFVVLGFDKACLFLVVSTLFEGFYMFNIFAPNHKGMPEIGPGVRLSFLEQQVRTARNVRGHPITDFVYLGLNYQIEHHLFPDTPRNNLRKLKPHVEEVCRKTGLHYSEAGVIESNRLILSELGRISQTA
ncbi:MAG: hypothetical protein DSY87_09240 [Methylococcus sp.]|nr:MAG: hypothetical protein DSY87_09240 [Methylococcus sp.]